MIALLATIMLTNAGKVRSEEVSTNLSSTQDFVRILPLEIWQLPCFQASRALAEKRAPTKSAYDARSNFISDWQA
jgi:hypothetical protein